MSFVMLISSWLLWPMRKILFRRDEWFDLVTVGGQVIGQAPRTICHRGPGLLHSVVHLHVVNSQGRLYLQKRGESKKIQPGKWDTSVGGHVDTGESVELALLRETREELGIEGFTPRHLENYRWDCTQESELVHSYLTYWEGEIICDPEEIDQGRFWTLGEIDVALGQGVFTPNFEQEYRRIREKIVPLSSLSK